MDIVAWLESMGALGWVLSVVVVGIAVNILSNFCQRWLDSYWADRPSKTRSKLVERETKMLWRLRRLHTDDVYRDGYIAQMVISNIANSFLVVGLLICIVGMQTSSSEHYVFRFPLDEGLNGFVYYIASTVAIVVLLLLVRRVHSSLDILSRLRNFKRQEAAYLSLVGSFPSGYDPLFKDYDKAVVNIFD